MSCFSSASHVEIRDMPLKKIMQGSHVETSLPLCDPARSGTKKEPKPKLFGPDIFGWGGGLPREGVGAKKFGMSLETREIKLFGGISRDFAGISRGRPKSLRKRKFGFNFRSLQECHIVHDGIVWEGDFVVWHITLVQRNAIKAAVARSRFCLPDLSLIRMRL